MRCESGSPILLGFCSISPAAQHFQITVESRADQRASRGEKSGPLQRRFCFGVDHHHAERQRAVKTFCLTLPGSYPSSNLVLQLNCPERLFSVPQLAAQLHRLLQCVSTHRKAPIRHRSIPTVSVVTVERTAWRRCFDCGIWTRASRPGRSEGCCEFTHRCMNRIQLRTLRTRTAHTSTILRPRITNPPRPKARAAMAHILPFETVSR